MLSFTIGDQIISSSIFHEKQNIIAFTSDKGLVSLWNWRSKTYLLQQESLSTELTAYAINQDFTALAVGDIKGDIKVFDPNSLLNTVTFKEFNRKITGLKFIKKNILVASSLDGLARVYSLDKRKMFRELIPEHTN